MYSFVVFKNLAVFQTFVVKRHFKDRDKRTQVENVWELSENNVIGYAISNFCDLVLIEKVRGYDRM